MLRKSEREFKYFVSRMRYQVSLRWIMDLEQDRVKAVVMALNPKVSLLDKDRNPPQVITMVIVIISPFLNRL